MARIGSGRLGGGIEWNWNQASLRQMLEARDGEVAQDVTKRARAVLRRLQTSGPNLSGTLRRSWHLSSVETSSSGPRQFVETDVPYVWPVESGRRAVAPTERRALRLFAGGSMLFRMSAKATQATRFVEAAVDAAVQ